MKVIQASDRATATILNHLLRFVRLFYKSETCPRVNTLEDACASSYRDIFPKDQSKKIFDIFIFLWSNMNLFRHADLCQRTNESANMPTSMCGFSCKINNHMNIILSCYFRLPKLCSNSVSFQVCGANGNDVQFSSLPVRSWSVDLLVTPHQNDFFD